MIEKFSDSKIIKPSFFEGYFGNLKEICFDDNSISIIKGETRDLTCFDDLDCYPVFKRGFFSDSLCICKNGSELKVNGISRKHRKSECIKLIEYFTPYFEFLVSTIDNEVFSRFLRDSKVTSLSKSIALIISSYQKNKTVADRLLSKKSKEAIKQFFSIFPLEEYKESIRQQFEDINLKTKSDFFQYVESNPLTAEQSLSVIRDNDRNLVLAGAGTGKTSVMVSKVLDITASGLANPDEILVLAYGKAAASEVNERIEQRCKKLLSRIDSPELAKLHEYSASTFHALGLKILRESKRNTHVSKLAEDNRKMLYWAHKKLIEFLNGGEKNVVTFIGLLYPKSDPLSFKTKQEYERFIRDNEYITLNGDKVRSYQELLIGNWLYLNGIEYEYEPSYTVLTRIEIGFSYKPDFHISDSNIYIEHYGIDREGNTRPGIDKEKYNTNIIKKRELHLKNETRLIETFHYEWCEDELLSNLEVKLLELGVEAKPIPEEKMFEKLNELGMISKFAEIMMQAIKATRVENLDIEQVQKRLEGASYSNSKEFIMILDDLKTAYEKELHENSQIDFDDMILQAVDCIKSNHFKPTWKYILVDEFQDISQARLNLILALLNAVPSSSLFAVGDDWQSIYRFSGGKLEITTRFLECLGSHSLTKLQKTFRYNNSIADTAGRFIMQNPEQYEKHIVTHDHVDNPQVVLIAGSSISMNKQDNPESKIATIAKKIIENDPDASIAVLGRYNRIIDMAKDELKQVPKSNKIKFWTFHKSKGLEADYCILAGFTQGRFGFPNDNKDYEAVEALLPTLDTYPYSEERRLMYVALTRAKKKVYIVADPLMPSLFVNELIIGGYNVAIHSKRFEERYRKIFKCHNCEDGYLIRYQKYDNPYYACNTYPGCHVITKACPKCSAPMKDNNERRKCNNPDCNETINLCPLCYRPLKLRNGKYGPFWGCSGFGAPEPHKCRYTKAC